MGLQDRDYTRASSSPSGRPQYGSGGLWRLRLWSVNSWIIAVNCLVFALCALVGPSLPVPVVAASDYDQSRYVLHPQYLYPNGSPVPTNEPVQFGRVYYRTLVDRQSGAVLVDGNTGRPVVGEQILINDAFNAYGHFSTWTGFRYLQVWRLVTFQFLHANLGHLFFNMLGLYIFGPLVEEYLGRKKYLAFYLVCGIFGGLSYLILNLAGLVSNSMGLGHLPGLLIEDPHVPLVGASAGVFGVIMACGRIEPNEPVNIAFTPITIKMWVAAYAYVAIAAINLLFGGQNAGGDAAHVGGAIAGFYFVLRPHLLTDFFDVFSDSRKVKLAPPPPPVAPQSRLDLLLEKVHTDGKHSLTTEEREYLHAETERIRSKSA